MSPLDDFTKEELVAVIDALVWHIFSMADQDPTMQERDVPGSTWRRELNGNFIGCHMATLEMLDMAKAVKITDEHQPTAVTTGSIQAEWLPKRLDAWDIMHRLLPLMYAVPDYPEEDANAVEEGQ